MTNDISKKALERIRKENIHPEAWWKFALRKTLLWTGIIFAGTFAAISLSLIIFSIFSIDQGIFGFAPRRLFSPTVFRSLPYIWIGSLLAFISLAVFEYRETGHGYRHRPFFVVLTAFLAVFTAGTLLHLLRVGERSDVALRKAIPQYEQSVRPREEFWKHPEDGFATGTISDTNDSGFLLKSPDGDALVIHVEKNTVVLPSVRIEGGRTVRVIGNQGSDGAVEAEEILPALPRRFGDENHEQGFDDDEPRPPRPAHPASQPERQ
ncbi:MAG: hypothetical protein HGA31_04665 [Candidatus Moranbacteria bacterium]|nr:hypothetical protein [Candidatus Moranbacteria bacterium]